MILDQFANPDNPLAHYSGTGPEIWRDTQGKVTHFVATMGTTGTHHGVLAFPQGEEPRHPGRGRAARARARSVPGIRKWPEEYQPKIYDKSRVDRIVEVSQQESEEMAQAAGGRGGHLRGHFLGRRARGGAEA